MPTQVIGYTFTSYFEYAIEPVEGCTLEYIAQALSDGSAYVYYHQPFRALVGESFDSFVVRRGMAWDQAGAVLGRVVRQETSISGSNWHLVDTPKLITEKIDAYVQPVWRTVCDAGGAGRAPEGVQGQETGEPVRT